ncbi:MAG: hypothetical protein K2L42_01690 [Clostridia bacterium]|nr:hypothetical protein [Clostridia bacterium]
MAQSKIEAYVGFCLKSGKITRGSGAVSTLKNGVYLIIVDGTAAKNTQKLAVKFKKRFSCPLLICKGDFGSIVNKDGCKLVAIRDAGLAKAILSVNDDNYELYFGGDI